MKTLSHNGAQYRTQLLDQAAADRFAACLRANSRFDGVMVNRSDRAKETSPRRWFVSYHPSSADALEALIQGQAQIQADRAGAQWADYLVVENEAGAYYVQSYTTGGVYETNPEAGCTCPHYVERCGPAAIACKHSGIVRIHLEQGTAIRLDASAPAAPAAELTAAERSARARRDREDLW